MSKLTMFVKLTESAAQHWRTLNEAALLIEVAKDTKFQDGQILTQVAAYFNASSATFDDSYPAF